VEFHRFVKGSSRIRLVTSFDLRYIKHRKQKQPLPATGISQGSRDRQGSGGVVNERYAVMDIMKMLDELRQEREAIEEAILTLERLANGQGRRRGRPPAWMAALKRKQTVEPGTPAVLPQRTRGRKPTEAAAQ
jgi:hypothetical protein